MVVTFQATVMIKEDQGFGMTKLLGGIKKTETKNKNSAKKEMSGGSNEFVYVMFSEYSFYYFKTFILIGVHFFTVIFSPFYSSI